MNFSPGAAAQGEKDWRDMEDKLQQRERKSVKKTISRMKIENH